jgi:hypothetical protein
MGGYGLPGVSLNGMMSARLPTHLSRRGMMGSFAASQWVKKEKIFIG